MIYFSQSVVEEIKKAADENALKEVIRLSLHEFQSKRRNGGPARGLILNIIMALKYEEEHELSVRAAGNVRKAIELLENIRSNRYENLF